MLQFKDLEVGDGFTCNGARYVKKSSRTVFLVHGSMPYRVFYFGMNEYVQKLQFDPHTFKEATTDNSCMANQLQAYMKDTVYKITFDLLANDYTLLEKLALDKECTTADIVRRAISYYKFFDDTVKDGGAVLVEDKNGTINKVIIRE